MKRAILEAFARLLSIFRRSRLDQDFEDELSTHIEMLAQQNQRCGLHPDEARRQAILRVGGLNATKELQRGARSIPILENLFQASLLDFKLGARMMIKYPGLTVVGLIGMGVAIAIGGAAYRIIDTIIDPTLPLNEGDRIVTIQNVNPTLADQQDRKTHLHDLITWRETMPAVQEFGAYRAILRNLIIPDSRVEPVRIAEMTASGFRIARVPPLVGRYFNDEDERTGSEPVVVIGYDVWQTRFAGDANIIGRTLQLGATPYTVIGVMPQGFGFPVNNRVWAPLRLDPAAFERGQAPPIEVFGRLAPGATLSEAQTQATTIGRRLAAAYPKTHEHSRPQVFFYAHIYLDNPELAWVFHLIQLFFSALLVVIGTNIAILVYARTVTRMGEIAVRTALGASRSRVVLQLFAEALVLSAAAAIVGLVVAAYILDWMGAFIRQTGGAEVPFWWNFEINFSTVLYAGGLAVLGAVIVGVLPALKATGGGIGAQLQSLKAGGGGAKLGRTWTALIVAQVAIAVMLLPIAIGGAIEGFGKSLTETGFASSEFLMASLRLDREGRAGLEADSLDGEFGSRYAYLQAEVIRRLEAEPGISSVALTTAIPGSEPDYPVEVEDGAAENKETSSGENRDILGIGITNTAVSEVDLGFFRAFEIPILAGRGFNAGDLSREATSVIVNRAFVQKVLGGGNALGRRVRYTRKGEEPGRWFEIVGIVPDFPAAANPGNANSRLYHPMVRSEIHPAILALRVRGAAPATFTDRLREVTTGVDPMLRLEQIATLDEILNENQFAKITALIVALVTLSVILLSAAGIYALMSVTVEQRRLEIGIRIALGADRRRILASIFGRALAQLGLGVAAGILPFALLNWISGGEVMGGHAALIFSSITAFMMAVGLLAAAGPARRGLKISPTEALKENG